MQVRSPDPVAVGPRVELEQCPVGAPELQPESGAELVSSGMRPRDREQEQLGTGLPERARQLQAELGDVAEDLAHDARVILVVHDDQLPRPDLVAQTCEPSFEDEQSTLHALEARREGFFVSVLHHLTSFRSAVVCGAAREWTTHAGTIRAPGPHHDCYRRAVTSGVTSRAAGPVSRGRGGPVPAMAQQTGWMRLFVAAWPDARTVGVLTALCGTEAGGVRWVPAPDWHVTLAFLGSVPEPELDALGEALGTVAASGAPVTAHLGPATRLLGRSVLCVPVQGLDELARAVLAATAPFSRSPDRDRPFLGHLTLARSAGRRPIPRQVAGRAISAAWPVDAIRLVRSTTAPRGAIYDTRAVFPLGGFGPSQDEHVFGYTVGDEHRLPDTPPP